MVEISNVRQFSILPPAPGTDWDPQAENLGEFDNCGHHGGGPAPAASHRARLQSSAGEKTGMYRGCRVTDVTFITPVSSPAPLSPGPDKVTGAAVV